MIKLPFIMYRVVLLKTDTSERMELDSIFFSSHKATAFGTEKKKLFGFDKCVIITMHISDADFHPAYQLWNLIAQAQPEDETWRPDFMGEEVKHE